MILRYALYERLPPKGYQWTWRAEGLKDSLLDDFIYRIVMPDNASTIQPDHLRGGIIKFSEVKETKLEVHLVFYRFYDGGSDEGRSRVTILAAWAEVNNFSVYSSSKGFLEILRNQMFERISKNARTIGIEQPYSLFSKEQIPVTDVQSSSALSEFLVGLTDDDYDYSLTVLDGFQTLKKTHSEAFKLKEAERVKQQTENPEKMAQKTEFAELFVREPKPGNFIFSNRETNKVSGRQIKSKPNSRMIFFIFAPAFVVFCVFIVFLRDQLTLGNGNSFSTKNDLNTNDVPLVNHVEKVIPFNKSKPSPFKERPEERQTIQEGSFKGKDSEGRDGGREGKGLDTKLNPGKAEKFNTDIDNYLLTPKNWDPKSEPFQTVNPLWFLVVAFVGVIILFCICLGIISKRIFFLLNKRS